MVPAYAPPMRFACSPAANAGDPTARNPIAPAMILRICTCFLSWDEKKARSNDVRLLWDYVSRPIERRLYAFCHVHVWSDCLIYVFFTRPPRLLRCLLGLCDLFKDGVHDSTNFFFALWHCIAEGCGDFMVRRWSTALRAIKSESCT